MRVIYMTVLALCWSSQCVRCSYEDEFVDPTDMLNYDRSTRSMKKKSNPPTLSEPAQNDRCTVFLSRFVKILIMNTGLSKLRNSNYEKGNSEEVKSRVSVSLAVKDLQLLENMANNKDIDYIEIDRILNSMFAPDHENLNGFQMGNDNELTLNQIKTVLCWILVGSVLIFGLYVTFHNIRYAFSLTFIVFIIFVLAFASTWYTMYTKAEINRSVHLEYLPSHCQKNAGGWFAWFKKHDLDECKRYKEAIYLDPKYSIALTEVFAEMFSKMLMKPIEILGDSIHVFNKSVLRDFPFWAQLIMIPIIIIIIIKTTLLACALLVGRHLNIKSMFGYGSTSIGSGPSNTERFTSYNRTNNSTRPVTSEHTAAQIPVSPKINFNINFLHPNSSNIGGSSTMRRDDFLLSRDYLKMNYKQEDHLISMLKNKEIDSVDSKSCNNSLVKRPRHRTLSI